MKAAVLGSPIAHSLSPVLHGAAYRARGLTRWSYEAIECDEAALPGVLDGCGPDWAGLSLTMPLKRAVLPLLDRVEPLAAGVGAANTVVFAGGMRHGHNTDVPGMVAALAEAGGTDAEAGPALILGAGATACAGLAAIRRLGWREATVAARDPGRASGLLDAAHRLGVAVRLAGFGDRGMPAPALLLSTVPGGATDTYTERIGRGSLRPRLVFDVVYHPWPTPLAASASAAGIPVVGGFALLLHQAAGQVQLMTGKPAPLESMRTAGLAVLRSRAEPR